MAWRALCRSCTEEVGLDAWCVGHGADGEAILSALGELPDEWATVTLLWWIASGEVRADRLAALPTEPLPAAIRAQLPTGTTSVRPERSQDPR